MLTSGPIAFAIELITTCKPEKVFLFQPKLYNMATTTYLALQRPAWGAWEHEMFSEWRDPLRPLHLPRHPEAPGRAEI